MLKMRILLFTRLYSYFLVPVLAGIILLIFYLEPLHEAIVLIRVIELIILWTIVALGLLRFSVELMEVNNDNRRQSISGSDSTDSSMP